MRHDRRHDEERGQGLVEFALVIPIILLVVVSVAELGLAFGNTHTLGYGSREGARVGSALATGNVSDCSGGPDPAGVDQTLVAAVQRILKSPGSGLDVSKVQQIRIFRADANGNEVPGTVNIWTYAGEQAGPEVDPGPGALFIDFAPPASVAWPACARNNAGANPDSIGVTVTYTYDFLTPMVSMLEAISGGSLSLTLRETTVMSLNPSI